MIINPVILGYFSEFLVDTLSSIFGDLYTNTKSTQI